jgi:hypothetical protein
MSCSWRTAASGSWQPHRIYDHQTRIPETKSRPRAGRARVRSRSCQRVTGGYLWPRRSSTATGLRVSRTIHRLGTGRITARSWPRCSTTISTGSELRTPKESSVDLQALTTIQQNNFTPQLPRSRDPITLTVCVTAHPSTTSRQDHFHRTVPLYMEGRI